MDNEEINRLKQTVKSELLLEEKYFIESEVKRQSENQEYQLTVQIDTTIDKKLDEKIGDRLQIMIDKAVEDKLSSGNLRNRGNDDISNGGNVAVKVIM